MKKPRQSDHEKAMIAIERLTERILLNTKNRCDEYMLFSTQAGIILDEKTMALIDDSREQVEHFYQAKEQGVFKGAKTVEKLIVLLKIYGLNI
jgi:hypothetical protein